LRARVGVGGVQLSPGLDVHDVKLDVKLDATLDAPRRILDALGDADLWLAPPNLSAPNAYREYLSSTCGLNAAGNWRPEDTMKCWRHKTCPPEVLSRILSTPAAAFSSCSAQLRAHGCLAMPEQLVSAVDSNGLGTQYSHFRATYRLLCSWLAPRDGCSCAPCFTECRRSELCPASFDSAAVPPLPKVPAGSYAYTFVLRLPPAPSPAGAVRQSSRELLRAVVSLVQTGTKHSIMLLCDGLADAELAPFRQLGVQVAQLSPLPEGVKRVQKRNLAYAILAVPRPTPATSRLGSQAE